MALISVSILSLAAWAVLALCRGGYWRARERLDPSPAPADWPAVIAVIPARNEAASISAAIRSHMTSDYPGPFTIVLVDDGSTDGTASIARAESGAQRLELINAPPLAPGWSGKLAAVDAGVRHAASKFPEVAYFLLTDADIVHAPTTLRRLVAKAESEKLVLASLMARLDSRGLWGALLIPAFVYFFQKLYPFPLVNDPARRQAAAAGGCMLVDARALDAAGGIAAIRDRLIDDCALADLLKRTSEGRAIWLGLADDEVVSRRDNRSLGSIWSMVERSAFTQLDRSWLKLASVVAGMALLYVAPPAIALSYPWHQDKLAGAIALAAWIVMALTFLPTARLYGLPQPATAALPIAGVLYTAMTVSSALQHLRGKGGRWKGRVYPGDAQPGR